MVKTYHRPSKIEEVLKLMANEEDKNVPLAGGTSLALNVRGVDGLVDLAGLGLTYIRSESGVLRIGATTPIREIQRSEPVRQAASGILSESAKNYLTALIRNRASLGGILATGNFWADIVTVLVALNASVKIRGATERVVTVEDFVRVGAKKALGCGLLTEISIPSSGPSEWCGYLRLAKVETDISILSVAAAVTCSGSTIDSARVVVGNGSRPIRLTDLEKPLRGQTPASAASLAADRAKSIPADSDIRASAEYRKEVAGVLVRRLFQSLQ